MKAETRPCLVERDYDFREMKDNDSFVIERETVFSRAFFHRFIDVPDYYQGEMVIETCALIENEDGQMERVEPDSVRFTDRQPEDAKHAPKAAAVE